jgi:hypothetical protein
MPDTANQIIREIETDELCPGGKPHRAFLLALPQL